MMRHDLARAAYTLVRVQAPKLRGRKRIAHAAARLLARSGPVTVNAFGLRFELDLRDHVEEQIFWEDYDRDTLEWWRSSISAKDVVLDVGANVGLYSLVAAQTGASVVAFEPNPTTRRRMERNVALNAFESRIRVRQEALSDRSGEALLFDDVNAGTFGANAGVASLSPKNAGGRSVSVQTATLDEVAAELGLERVDWIKLDIQGAELAALTGGKATLERHRPRLLLEIDENASRNMGWSESDLRALLVGYGIRRIDGMNVVAEPTSRS